MAITQELREIGGIINSTDLNYNFNRIQEELQLAVEGVVFKDGYSQIETIAERNAISADILCPGLWVAVSESGMVYEYDATRDTMTVQKRYFGINDGDLPEIPYRIEGNPASGESVNAVYVCRADSKEVNWKYLSETTGETYNDGDWAVYLKDSAYTEGYWIRVPKWIEIMNVSSILENGIVGELENLHTEAKDNIVNAINEVHDELGDVPSLTTEAKDNAVNAINEVDSRTGKLTDLTTEAKNSLVAGINEVDANVGPIENLTTINKGNMVLAINEIDAEIGTLTDLHTEDKTTVVNSINEVHDDLGTLSDLTTTEQGTAVGAINELDTTVGKLTNLTTTTKTNIVSAVNEVDGDVGDISTLTTTEKANIVSAVNELKAGVDALQGAYIYIGIIELVTSAVTQEALTARAKELTGKQVLRTGWVLTDLEKHEWYYNGALDPKAWIDLGMANTDAAQNDILGTVRGSATGDISITDGNMTVLNSANASNLNNLPASDYATQTDIGAKADKTNVLEKDNTTAFTPTADYHPATKEYVDNNKGAFWGEIRNNITDQTDLIDLLDNYAEELNVLTKDNTLAYTPTEDYHPTTKTYVDQKMDSINTWGRITGDIADQTDLQNELINKQDKATAWNNENLIVGTQQPEVPTEGFIIWIDVNS